MNINHTDIQRNLAEAEYKLSAVAAVPVIGAVAGITKIVIGIIETLGGLLVAAVQDKALGFSYCQHGLYNIMAGFFEAIPIVGTVIFLVRISQKETAPDYALKDASKDVFTNFNSQAGLFRTYEEVYKNETKVIYYDRNQDKGGISANKELLKGFYEYQPNYFYLNSVIIADPTLYHH